jgi:DNA repair exonuclease SbcCD ATPase subunit
MRLTAADRRIVIDDIFDTEILNVMKGVLKTDYDAQILELIKVGNQLSEVRAKLALQTKYIEDSKKNTEELIKTKDDNLKVWQEEAEKLGPEITTLQEEIKKLQSEIGTYGNVQDKLRKLENYEIQINQNLRGIKDDRAFYQDNDTCPRCRQGIANRTEMLHTCTGKIDELETGLQTLVTTKQTLKAKITEIQALQLKITGHQSEITKIQARLTELQRYCRQIGNEIETLRSKKPAGDEVMKTAEALEAELTALKQRDNELSEEKQYNDLAALLLKDSGIKARIIKQYLPVVNKTINQYLEAMDFFVNFNLDEEFNEIIKSRHRDEFEYESFSEGQKRRIDLSLLFTWRSVAKLRNSVNMNILILDEVLDGSLDSDGMDEFLRLLHTFGEGTNCFLISHRGDVLADKFNNVLEFELSGTFSELTVR